MWNIDDIYVKSPKNYTGMGKSDVNVNMQQRNMLPVSNASPLYFCHCRAIINAIVSEGNLIIVSLGASYLPQTPAPWTKRYCISASIDYVAWESIDCPLLLYSQYSTS